MGGDEKWSNFTDSKIDPAKFDDGQDTDMRKEKTLLRRMEMPLNEKSIQEEQIGEVYEEISLGHIKFCIPFTHLNEFKNVINIHL